MAMRSTIVLTAQVLVAGTAVGELLLLPEPLSLWGGLNPETGEICDRRHPCAGQIVTGKVLALPAGRGSSSASSILLEAVRQGSAPAAIITSEVDGILALGAAVAREMYAQAPPVLVLPPEAYALLPASGMIHIAESGEILCEAGR
jgi:predicted aconitase with swiveling domain